MYRVGQKRTSRRKFNVKCICRMCRVLDLLLAQLCIGTLLTWDRQPRFLCRHWVFCSFTRMSCACVQETYYTVTSCSVGFPEGCTRCRVDGRLSLKPAMCDHFPARSLRNDAQKCNRSPSIAVAMSAAAMLVTWSSRPRYRRPMSSAWCDND